LTPHAVKALIEGVTQYRERRTKAKNGVGKEDMEDKKEVSIKNEAKKGLPVAKQPQKIRKVQMK
jgi:hypothetical protein